MFATSGTAMTRMLGVSVALLVAVACATSEEEGLFEEGSGGSGPLDASSGSGGSVSGGTGGGAVDAGWSGSGGTSADAAGGGSGFGGSSGVGGVGGASGTGGSGSCNPAFCPNTGSGAPCCVTANGPCGSDMGLGCQQNPGPDY